MEFVTLDTLRGLSGYRDRRSIKRWINSLGLTLHKVGKNWGVVRSELDAALCQRYQHAPVTPRERASTAQEDAFLSDLQEFLAEL